MPKPQRPAGIQEPRPRLRRHGNVSAHALRGQRLDLAEAGSAGRTETKGGLLKGSSPCWWGLRRLVVLGIGSEGVEAKRVRKEIRQRGLVEIPSQDNGGLSSRESNVEEWGCGNAPSGCGSRFQRRARERLRTTRSPWVNGCPLSPVFSLACPTMARPPMHGSVIVPDWHDTVEGKEFLACILRKNRRREFGKRQHPPPLPPLPPQPGPHHEPLLRSDPPWGGRNRSVGPALTALVTIEVSWVPRL